jgi:hypothetical protein
MPVFRLKARLGEGAIDAMTFVTKKKGSNVRVESVERE